MYHALVRRQVRRTFAALNQGDAEPALAGLAERFDHRFAGDHALGGRRQTRPAMRLWFERLFRLNHSLAFELQHVAVSGPPWNTTALAQWTDRAHLADGGDYINSGVHVIRMRWGKIVALHAYLDTARWAAACQRMAEAGIAEASAAPIEG